jgi:hypothetical protein
MVTGVLGEPVGTLLESVGWKEKFAGNPSGIAMVHPVAATLPLVSIVANAVAVAPTCIERLLGRTEAARAGP